MNELDGPVRQDQRRHAACALAIDGARIGHANNPEEPGDPGLVDIALMCDNLVRLGSDPVVGPARALRDVVRNKLVVWMHAQQHRFHGVSLYCKPTNRSDKKRSIMEVADPDESRKDAEAYQQLALCKATGWDRVALNPLRAPQPE